MRKINYFSFLKEAKQFEVGDDQSISYDPNAKLGKKSQFGCTIQTHDGTHLQFTHEPDFPGHIRVQEWTPTAANNGKILRGGSKLITSADAFDLAANRAIPEQQVVVANHFRGLHGSAYVDFMRKRNQDQRATEQ